MADLNKTDRKKSPKNNNNIYWIYAVVLAFFIIGSLFLGGSGDKKEILFEDFKNIWKEGKLEKVVVINGTEVEVYLKEDDSESDQNQLGGEVADAYFKVNSAENFERFLFENNIRYEVKEKFDYSAIIQILIPIAVLIALWFFFMRRVGAGGAGGQIFNIGKSRASLYDKENKVNVTFNDVAGLDEAKEEVQEVVEFLKNPQKFTKLGGHIPKGVLLVGPPGTGKTLLAKAVAGEAKVPFFSLSGSDFVEMFVGVGAARVRDLFKQAKEKAPCIVFIDEIDAVGRSRGRVNITGGNDERENTLNQLLVEMDGFNSDTGVIIMAATNRPDVLDPALLRAGRFDRQIAVDRPDIKGREAIFKVHLKKLTLSTKVDVQRLAFQTPGFVGADIMNVCNEAALIAARKNKKAVEMDDFQDAIDRVIGGLEKKSKIISQEEKKIVAYHEAGHAISGWFLKHAHPLVKVSIVPRGIAALGYAQYLPKEQYLHTYSELIDSMCMMLGGRAAEEIVFGEEYVSTGAQNDLQRITDTSYAMIRTYGMNKKVGLFSFVNKSDEYNFTRPYSEATAQTIDEEARKLVDFVYERTIKLLIEKREELNIIAHELLENEVLFKDDMERLIGLRPFDEPSVEEQAESDQDATTDQATEVSNTSLNDHPHSNGVDKPANDSQPDASNKKDQDQDDQAA